MKNVKEIEFKIENEEWTALLDKAFKKVVKDANVDGFRKGTCPKDVFIKKFGTASLYEEASNMAIDDAYRKVIDNNNLKPVCPGKVDITEINDNGITYKFTVIEKPEVKLGKYTKLGVKKDVVKVSDEEIDIEIENLKSKYADIIEINEGTAQKGDTAVINFEGFVDGEALEGGTASDYPLELGTNTFIPGFEDGVIGMNVGEEKELNLKFPEDYVDNLKGKDVLFKVKLNLIKRRVFPELNEDFFKDCGYDNVKDATGFKDAIKKSLEERKNKDAENKYENELIQKALENIEVEINPEIIDNEVERIVDNYRYELEMQGLTLEQYFEFTKGNLEDLKKNIRPQAINTLKSRYLLEAIIEKENIEVSDDEVDSEIKKMANMYNITEEEVLASIENKEYIKYDLRMRKAIDELKK